MASLQGTLVLIEREPGDIAGTAPRRVFIGDHPTLPGYVFVTDRSEATAWLKSDGLGGYVFDDDPANDNLKPFLVATSPDSIILIP